MLPVGFKRLNTGLGSGHESCISITQYVYSHWHARKKI